MAAEVRLGEVAEIIMGQSPPGETYNESGEGLPFFQGVADFNYRHPPHACTAPRHLALLTRATSCSAFGRLSVG